MKKKTIDSLPDLDLDLLNVRDSDDVLNKMLMLIEGTYGKGIQHSIRKYGYTEQRYHQLLKSFKESGTEALFNKKKGPKVNYVRTDKLIQLIIRYRYLDPQSPASVIAQKLKQDGYKISVRSVERTIQEYGMQKKLFKLSPNRKNERFLIQKTKREKTEVLFTEKHNERYSREILANKLSGTHVGIWLLIPEYLRLGAWDLLKGCFQDSSDNSLHTRLGLQLVNESAMCINRMRKKDSLCNQGFSLASGLPYLATDEAIHNVLDSHTMMDYEQVQIALMQIRKLEAHYHSEQIFALDPHRLDSVTQRMMPAKKKKPDQPAHKIMQTFFCIDAISGQPLGNCLGSSGKTTSSATMRLMHMIEQGGIDSGLFMADKEHFTKEIISYFYNHQSYDVLMPAPQNKNIANRFTKLEYTKLWAGYAIATTDFKFEGSKENLRLLVQRQGESAGAFYYKAFITTSCLSPELLLTELYPKRWTIEEFFNFNGEMGWNRASTFNLNIKYGKQTMALIAQAAVHQLKRKLPIEYQSWTAAHTANQLFANMEGDIRVDNDTIIVTYYRDHQNLNLKQHFENLPRKLQAQGVNPKIPWLYDFKLDFRFK